MADAWETQVIYGPWKERLEKALAEGWEPYAIVPVKAVGGQQVDYYLKRKKQSEPDRVEGDK